MFRVFLSGRQVMSHAKELPRKDRKPHKLTHRLWDESPGVYTAACFITSTHRVVTGN